MDKHFCTVKTGKNTNVLSKLGQFLVYFEHSDQQNNILSTFWQTLLYCQNWDKYYWTVKLGYLLMYFQHSDKHYCSFNTDKHYQHFEKYYGTVNTLKNTNILSTLWQKIIYFQHSEKHYCTVSTRTNTRKHSQSVAQIHTRYESDCPSFMLLVFTAVHTPDWHFNWANCAGTWPHTLQERLLSHPQSSPKKHLRQNLNDVQTRTG